MSRARLCPECHGRGKIDLGFLNRISPFGGEGIGNTTVYYSECFRCNGTGVILPNSCSHYEHIKQMMNKSQLADMIMHYYFSGVKGRKITKTQIMKWLDEEIKE